MPGRPHLKTRKAQRSTPASRGPDPQQLQHLPLTYRVDEELRVILRALPTKAVIEALVGRVEEAYRKELGMVKYG